MGVPRKTPGAFFDAIDETCREILGEFGEDRDFDLEQDARETLDYTSALLRDSEGDERYEI